MNNSVHFYPSISDLYRCFYPTENITIGIESNREQISKILHQSIDQLSGKCHNNKKKNERSTKGEYRTFSRREIHFN